MTPADLRAIASLFLALQRLPLETPGVAVSIALRQWYSEGNHAWLDLWIDPYELRLAMGQHFYNADVDGDTESDTLFELGGEVISARGRGGETTGRAY
jgi:hypothetical protein